MHIKRATHHKVPAFHADHGSGTQIRMLAIHIDSAQALRWVIDYTAWVLGKNQPTLTIPLLGYA